MALVLDGNGTMTVGNGDITGITAGAIESTAIGSGAVLQVVSASGGNDFSTTSTSFVTTNFLATITPTRASSKILIILDTSYWFSSAGTAGYNFLTLYRNSTNLGIGTESAFQICGYMGNTSNYSSPASFQVYDSPNTTSATTYTVYSRSSSGTAVGTHDARVGNRITLMEIAA